MTTLTHKLPELPELPEPDWSDSDNGFSADQMTAYALKVREETIEKCAAKVWNFGITFYGRTEICAAIRQLKEI